MAAIGVEFVYSSKSAFVHPSFGMEVTYVCAIEGPVVVDHARMATNDCAKRKKMLR